MEMGDVNQPDIISGEATFTESKYDVAGIMGGLLDENGLTINRVRRIA